MADSDPTGGGILIADPPASADNQPPAGSDGASDAPAVSDGSKKPTGWRQQLSEPLQTEERLGKFDGKNALDRLATSYLELEERMGRAVEKPGEDATAEDLSRFYAQIGRPETPEGYDLSDVALPDGIKLTEDAANLSKAVAHKLGLDPRQARGLVETIAARDAAILAATIKANKTSLKKGLEGLQSEWGDDFTANRELAHRTIETYLGKDFMGILTRSGMDQYPALLKGMARIGHATAEGAAPRGGSRPAGEDSMEFPEAAKAARLRKGG